MSQGGLELVKSEIVMTDDSRRQNCPCCGLLDLSHIEFGTPMLKSWKTNMCVKTGVTFCTDTSDKDILCKWIMQDIDNLPWRTSYTKLLLLPQPFSRPFPYMLMLVGIRNPDWTFFINIIFKLRQKLFNYYCYYSSPLPFFILIRMKWECSFESSAIPSKYFILQILMEMSFSELSVWL